MLQYPSPIRHRNTWAAVFVLSLLIAAISAWQRGGTRQPEPVARVQVQPAPSPSAVIPPAGTEVSLQETLDRLGFTVNVPQVYHGHPLLRWNNYRVGDRSDAIEAGRFTSQESFTVRELSMQSFLGPETTLGIIGDDGSRRVLLPPTHQAWSWYSRTYEPRESPAPDGAFRFFIDHPVQGWGPESNKTLYSTAKDNPEHAAQLILLPAITGGRWVAGAGNGGHWDGGIDTGEYILAWEDLVHGDHDYQDMVYLVSGVQVPGDRTSYR